MTTMALLVFCSLMLQISRSQLFTCDNETRVINESDVCNGYTNCIDGTDESYELCANTTCTDSQFQCDYGACIANSSFCDGNYDCSDNSDEEVLICAAIDNCSSTGHGSDLFRCNDGTCIYSYHVCNEFNNCNDGSDETDQACAANTCSSGYFQCLSGHCIGSDLECNEIEDCKDGSDERVSSCRKELSYCMLASANFDIPTLMSRYGGNMTREQAVAFANTSAIIRKWGLDVRDPVIHISLLFINVITGIFIIKGLYLFHKTVGFENININYVVLLIIILEMTAIASIDIMPMVNCQFTEGTDNIAGYIKYAPIFMDVLKSGAIGIMCYTYGWHQYSGVIANNFKCSCACLEYLILSLSIIVVAFMYSHLHDSLQPIIIFWLWMLQFLLPVVWCRMIVHGYIKCNGYLRRFMSWKLCRTRLFWTVILILSAVGVLIDYPLIQNSLTRQGSDCIIFVLQWISPMFIILNVMLLLSGAKYAILLSAMNSFGIFIIGKMNNDMCTSIMNVVFISYSFMIPIYMIMIFSAIKELSRWKFSIISMYIVSWDEITNLVVIYFFLRNGDYWFAALQIFFTFMGHIFGSFSNNVFGDEYKNLTIIDKIISFLGFGRPHFVTNSWSEIKGDKEDYSKIYTRLVTKHKIWVIIFESFPSIVLSIYAGLTTKGMSMELISSIVISCIAVTYNTWSYMMKVTYIHDQETGNKDDDDKLVSIELQSTNTNEYKLLDANTGDKDTSNDKKSKCLPKWCSVMHGNKKFYFKCYLYMVSDFYIRSIPLICLMALIPCGHHQRYICIPRIITFCVVFGSLLMFEFIMNKRMRIKSYTSNSFILQIFSVSLFSSFYNLLSSLDILKNDRFFGQSVVFRSFMFEHKCRIVLSMVISVICISLLSINEKTNLVHIVIFFLSLYIVLLPVNILISRSF